jgi:hypothetical protein
MNKGVVNKSMLAAVGFLVAASMAFAKSPRPDLGSSSKKSANVNIYTKTPISGGPTLQAGEYQVVLSNQSPTPEIGFYQNGKLVAQVPAKLVDQGKEFDDTSIYYDDTGATLAISEMDLVGWREAVLFGNKEGDDGSTK